MSAMATGECTCGCGSIHLRVNPASPPASEGSPFPSQALAELPNGRGIEGIVFIDDSGHMSLLAPVWLADEEPATMTRPPWRWGRWVQGKFSYESEDGEAP